MRELANRCNSVYVRQEFISCGSKIKLSEALNRAKTFLLHAQGFCAPQHTLIAHQTAGTMGITDFFASAMEYLHIGEEAHADAPEKDDEEESKDEGGDEKEEKEGGDDEGEEKEEGGDDEEKEEGGDDEEEEEEEEEPVDPKPALEEGMYTYSTSLNLDQDEYREALLTHSYRMRQVIPMQRLQAPLR
jgi:hypothetical protein